MNKNIIIGVIVLGAVIIIIGWTMRLPNTESNNTNGSTATTTNDTG